MMLLMQLRRRFNLFISRIVLDLNKYETKKAIFSPQMLHAVVEGCFPDNNEKERKLWRLDRLNSKLYLLILSPTKPDFTKLAQQMCSTDTKGETKDYMPLLSSINEGMRFRFRLAANPVRSVKTENNTRGKVHAHVTVDQKRDWLVKKAVSCGFITDKKMFEVVEMDSLHFWRNSNEPPVDIKTSIFEGELEVENKELFIQSLIQGIGRAKAYGCGLLTLARV